MSKRRITLINMDIQIRNYQTKDCTAILAIINEAILNSTALYDYHPRSLDQQMAIFEDKISKEKYKSIKKASEKENIKYCYLRQMLSGVSKNTTNLIYYESTF